MQSNYKPVMRCMVLLLFLATACSGRREAKPVFVVVREPGDVIPIHNPDSVPYVIYDNEYDFGELSIEEKKSRFIDLMLPAILTVKFNFDQKFRKVDQILQRLHQDGSISSADSAYLDEQQNLMRGTSWWDTRRRLKTHPVSIVLAQAAVESGWGSSRFFKEANNIFGVWSFDQNEDRIRSLTDRSSGGIYLRAYPNISRSIEDYFFVIGRSGAYRRFRRERMKSDDPLRLINFLSNYSELRGLYIRKLRVVIEQNNLQQYDSSHLIESFVEGKSQLIY